MSGINAIKIYGERNTGTNYVSELLRANFGLRELPGVEALTDKDWARFIRLKKLGFERAVTWAYERTSNRYHARHFNENLGWKHACVPVERVASLAPQGVGLIGLVKNPYAFLTSIYRRPYHHAGKAATLEAFVQEPFTLHARDLLGRARMTPVQIWAAKTRSYFALANRLDSAKVVRYEDLLADEAGVLSMLAETWGIAKPASWQTVEASTKGRAKGQQKSRSWYAQYYLQQEWRSELSDAAIQAINSQLDPELMEMCGYDLLDVTGTNTGAAQTGASIVKSVFGGTPSTTHENGPMWAADAPLSTSRLSAY